MAPQGSASHGSASSPHAAAVPEGPPYPPQYQALGEVPSVLPDVPINAVFLVLFIAAGAGHAFIFRRNLMNGKKFLISIMPIIFCITRIFATTLRIVWANYPTNVQVGIAAMIFVYAGTILLFLANLFFSQRIVRAQHPGFGWSKPFTIALPVTFVITITSIFCLIAAVIVEFYSLNPYSLHASRDIQKYGSCVYAIVSFLPIPVVGISILARRHPYIRHTKTTDKFGEGSMRLKVLIVFISAFFLCLGASYRAGQTLRSPHPVLTTGKNPKPAPYPDYLSKASFYVFNFTIEICIVFFWLIIRIDKRFYIPNGASGPHSYANGFVFAGEPGNEKIRMSTRALGAPSLNASQSSFGTGRPSWTGSRGSLHARESRMSWGGISREAVGIGIGEDGRTITFGAYTGNDPEGFTSADVGVEGAEQELGWDPKSGKWAVRPVSSMTNRPPSQGSSSRVQSM